VALKTTRTERRDRVKEDPHVIYTVEIEGYRRRRRGREGSLDVLVVFAELFVVEAELVHEVGGHLLDLVVGERLRTSRRTLTYTTTPPNTAHNTVWVVCGVRANIKYLLVRILSLSISCDTRVKGRN